MERNNWNNRDNDRNERSMIPERNERRSRDEDSYRGAYRLDTSSDHRNETTWNGYGSTERGNNRGEERFRDNNTYRTHHDRGYDHDNYNMNSRYRDQGGASRGGYSSSGRDDQYNRGGSGYGNRYGGDNNQQHRSVHDRIERRDAYGTGNFNSDYRQDSYGNGGGANYGNEAGSLSYGYDGTSNYDPDWNRQYNPLTGERKSYHGDYTSRHPDREQQYRQNRNDRRNWNDNDRYDR
ncbi:hypothetical protein [Pontibacter akesuensis]|uniref:Uncharacterized protein n=1 Tax=Pontibacter akesuensis TaxID=388950 RepID=A0A1I7FSM0_9BACT|nr:hypothetical protein [Pontibacter akesuensis]GHA60710.1 hypothetical protein GCM10007389_11240 [Pontibacter akesuensis]SFU39202.1 hypothetical protein SAMN04487941_0437 [Pontibacter akesuensis]